MEKEKQEIHHEDLALKTAAQYFGEELMPLMGISGAIALIAPTESVKLEARQMYQDFNYVMADNGWVYTIRSRVTLLSLDSKEQVSGEILETAENIVLSILENREFPLMKSLAPIMGDRAKAKEILLQVKEILRKSLSQCFMVETGSQTAEKASLKLNKLKIIKLMEATDNALMYIDQNGDMNLLSACLCGKYRRIAWQK